MRHLSTKDIPQYKYGKRTFITIWVVTRACDLACVHCRANAEPMSYPEELSTKEALGLISQVAEWKVPFFVVPGGYPLKRMDFKTLIGECSRLKINFTLAPSVTPLLTLDKLQCGKAVPDIPGHHQRSMVPLGQRP